MINIKCSNKNQVFVFSVLQKCWPEKLHQKFSALSKHFSFFKLIKKLGWKVFEKTFHPSFFFICLYFIGVGGDENLTKYLAKATFISYPSVKKHVLGTKKNPLNDVSYEYPQHCG